jgi:competence protein ComEC
VITFVIAPAAVVAAALAPFGLAEPALDVMAAGLDTVRAIGATFAERPEAVRSLPTASVAAFLLAVAGIVWACLWRGWVRWLGAALMITAAIVYVVAPKPVLLADGDLRAVLAHTPDGWVAAGDARRNAFARERLGGLAGLHPIAAARLPPPDGCDAAACVWKLTSGRLVARVTTPDGFSRACAAGAIVLSTVEVLPGFVRRCRPALTIGPSDLTRRGGLSVAERGGSLFVRRARDGAALRPWSGDLRRNAE